MTNSTPFHVYAIDGYESAHKTAAARGSTGPEGGFPGHSEGA